MSANYTPGVRKIVGVDALDGSGATALEVEVDGHTICHVYPGECMSGDAALICAAPDLLAALQRFLVIEECAYQMEQGEIEIKEDAAISAARAAIKKATHE